MTTRSPISPIEALLVRLDSVWWTRRMSQVRTIPVAVLAVVVGLVCAESSSSVNFGVRMERTPAYVLGYCKKSPWLPLACPHLLPRMSQPSPHWEASLCRARLAGCAGLRWDDLSLVDAGYGTRPPAWSHVVVEAGDLARAFPFTYPTGGPKVTELDGVFARSRSRAVYIGTFTWGGRRGTVVLAPAFPSGGEQGDHLIFRWREGHTDLAVGLHGWEPLSQALAVLRQMVISI
jgi:hypothetical protein